MLFTPEQQNQRYYCAKFNRFLTMEIILDLIAELSMICVNFVRRLQLDHFLMTILIHITFSYFITPEKKRMALIDNDNVIIPLGIFR